MIQSLYTKYLNANRVTTDSRNIKEGDIYFALKGDRFDGNKFAKGAIDLGANYAVVDNAEYAVSERYILVDNVLTTLQNLAKYHRDQLNIPVIGITGSNGKTTSKELIKSVLSQQFNAFATFGNLNNHIGVPLSLLQINDTHEIAIIEMGANHQKEIEFLSGIAQPDYGYITNIGKAHLEGFGGEEGVLKGKTELFTYLKKHNKKAFIRLEDEKLNPYIKTLDSIVFGEGNQVYCKGNLKNETPTLLVEFCTDKISGTCKTHLIGAYNYHNVLSAITIGAYFGLSSEQIIKGIECYIPTNNRSQIIENKSVKIILDAYNANPTSMQGALDSFIRTKATNKYVILGDMLELGEYSEKEHEEVVRKIEENNIEGVLVGKEFKSINQSSYTCYSSTKNLEDDMSKIDFSDTLVLIKGSRGIGLEKLLPFINEK